MNPTPIPSPSTGRGQEGARGEQEGGKRGKEIAIPPLTVRGQEEESDRNSPFDGQGARGGKRSQFPR